jgi:GNAT superfamily N-acetyltransferase
MFVDLDVGDPRWREALPVLRQLRTHLDEASFAAIHRAGRAQGLTFTTRWDADRCVAVAGWRVIDTTHVGRKLYVDDLVTDEQVRSGGHGGALLDHLAERATELGCRTIELDSGEQRLDAHRFYRREGFVSYLVHFRRTLG